MISCFLLRSSCLVVTANLQMGRGFSGTIIWPLLHSGRIYTPVFVPVTTFQERVGWLRLQSRVPNGSSADKVLPSAGLAWFQCLWALLPPVLTRRVSSYWQVLPSEVEPSCLCHLGTTSRGFQKSNSKNKLQAVAPGGLSHHGVYL